MIVAHLADTHLGCIGTGWQPNVPDPFASHISLRQQEADIRRAFAEAIDRIATLKPDLLLHAGDLFDSAHPTPHAVQFAFSQFKKLSEAGVPVVILEGDHSAPRTPAQGEPLQILSHLPGVRIVCGDRMQRIALKDVDIYAVPHRALLFDPDAKQLGNVVIPGTSRLQILVAHGVADGLPFYQTHRSAAWVAVRGVAHLFDYVALGHCHRFGQVPGTDRAFYAGASAVALTSDFRPETTFSFNVARLEKGKPPEVQRELLGTRPMRQYGLSSAEGCSAEEIMGFIARQLESCPAQGAYCRVEVDGIEPSVRSQLSHRAIERLFPVDSLAGLSIKLSNRLATQGELTSGTAQTPRARFLERLKQEDMASEKRERVAALGNRFFDDAEAQLRTEDQESAV